MSNEKSKSKSPLRFSSTNHSRTPDSAIKGIYIDNLIN